MSADHRATPNAGGKGLSIPLSQSVGGPTWMTGSGKGHEAEAPDEVRRLAAQRADARAAKDFAAARTECGAMIKAIEKRLRGEKK